MAVRPPQSIEEWRVWEDACIQAGHREYIPENIGFTAWPDGVTQGPSWLILAQDHPFAGYEICWRCIAEAQKYPLPEGFPHRRSEYVTCWAPPEGDADTEDLQPDSGPAEDSAPADGGNVEESPFHRPQATDTGNLFWPPPGWSSRLEAWRQQYQGEFPEAQRPVHEPPWVITEDGRHAYAEGLPAPPYVEGLQFERHPQPPEPWQGFPSWTDDASAAEPVQADLTEREAQHDAQPVQAHPAEDEDRQPAADEEP